MPLAKCARCDKLFEKTAFPVCITCMPAEESDYEAIRECLKDHPEMTVEIISETTGVTLACVMRMLEQGLIVNEATVGISRCGRCGAPAISATKKLCNGCLEEMNREVAKQRHLAQAHRRKEVRIGEFSTVRESMDSKRGQTG